MLAVVRQLAPLGNRVAIQHRHPDATGRRFWEEANALSELCRPAGMPLFINGRLDVAIALEAHLHLPSDGPRPSEVRPQMPADRWVSAAVHSELELAEAMGADLFLVSPVFPAASKPDDDRPPLCSEGFRQLASRASAPAYALGGVTQETAPELCHAGGLAVISAVFRAADPLASAERLLETLDD